MTRDIICAVNIFANRNNVHEIKFWRIGIGIYSWPKYQRIDEQKSPTRAGTQPTLDKCETCSINVGEKDG